jgi:ABC-type transport system involved in cytochrome bd biosynthesis fused ATPase/permease subunit
VVASHSPAVLAACDRVFVLDRGRVDEVADPEAAQEAAAG